jgi:hypothetical protein
VFDTSTAIKALRLFKLPKVSFIYFYIILE